jgi:hypothetical protein
VYPETISRLSATEPFTVVTAEYGDGSQVLRIG